MARLTSSSDESAETVNSPDDRDITFQFFADDDDPEGGGDNPDAGGEGDGDPDGEGDDDNPETIELTEDELQNRIQEEVEPVVEKKEELLDEKKSLKSDYEELQEQNNKLEERLNELEQEKLEEDGDVEAIKEKLQEQHQEKVEEYEEKLQEKEQKIEKLVIDNNLTRALSSIGVVPELMDAAEKLHRDDIVIEENDDGELVPVIDDGVEGSRSLEDYLEEWKETEQGAYFIEADPNSGGGANGDGGGVDLSDIDVEYNPWKEEHFNLTKQMELSKELSDDKVERLKQEAELANAEG